MAEFERFEAVVLTGDDPQERRVIANVVLENDHRSESFWRWWLEDVDQYLTKKRGVTHAYRAGVYEVRKKAKGKPLVATIMLVGHTAVTPDDRKGQTRISRSGKISVKVL